MSPDWRTLAPGQRSEVWVAPVDDRPASLLFETDAILIEAPNWSIDGRSLYVNGDGRLWRLDIDDPSQLQEVRFDSLPAINNDHVLSADGRSVFMSAMDGHIYRGSLDGGAVTRVSPDDGKWHFLHGVSGDASRIAYVELGSFDEAGRLVVAPSDGSGGSVVDTGPRHLDGPEWSPGEEWLYFNTEAFTDAPGHAQLARIPDGGGALERLLESDTVDWFPHLSPDGSFATYIVFPAGTLGHPADLDVEVRLVETSDWSTPLATHALFGGQGTLNVNSWGPDSDRFAFVGYPTDAR